MMLSVKSIFAFVCIALILALTVACGQDPVPTPTATSAPTEIPTPLPPTQTPVAGPVAASNIPFPTPVSPESIAASSAALTVLESAHESMTDAGGYAFKMSGVLIGKTEDGTEIEVPVAYSGDALPDYNSGSVALDTPDGPFEFDMISLYRMSYTLDDESVQWSENERLLALFALTNPRFLFGADLRKTDAAKTLRQMNLEGQEVVDGVNTHVIRGKLLFKLAPGEGIELMDVAYWIGVDDELPRQIEIEGDIEPSVLASLTADINAETDRAKLTVRFFDYGKSVDYVAPDLAMSRFGHAALLLDDGRFLVFGGLTGVGNNGSIAPLPHYIVADI